MSVVLARANVIHEAGARTVESYRATAAAVMACGTVLDVTGLKYAARPEQFPSSARWCNLCSAIHYHTPPLKGADQKCNL